MASKRQLSPGEPGAASAADAKKPQTAGDTPEHPEFFSRAFLLKHIADIVAFYEGRVVDPAGGYHQNFYLDGSPFNPGFQQIVSSTRMVVNFCYAGKVLGRPELLEIARHGLAYLDGGHWVAEKEMYAFSMRDHQPEDMTQQSYAYAFVLMAHAMAFATGVTKDASGVAKVYDLMERRYWLPAYGAYADTLSPEGVMDGYRGQNSNMHICEALLVAYEHTRDERYLRRAEVLADTFTRRLASKSDGMVWEHYTPSFDIDWEYGKGEKNIYRPWGFQPGHQIEWAKNLLNLRALQTEPAEWLLQRARELFDVAYEISWDEEHGGLVYGYSPERKWCDDDKYFWVQAESMGTAALLFDATGDAKYRACYDALWGYSWKHFVDHKYGGWYQLLSRDNKRYTDEKATAGFKTDYHTLVSCVEALKAFKEA